MPFQVSPGVNVSEIDLTTIVPAVATTEGAVAGVFRWGPVDKSVLVDNEDKLVNRFGRPTNHNPETFFTAANFLSYGNKLYVSRGANTVGFSNAFGSSTTTQGSTKLYTFTNTAIATVVQSGNTRIAVSLTGLALEAGMDVFSPSIPAGTTISSGNSTSITLSAAPTANATETVIFRGAYTNSAISTGMKVQSSAIPFGTTVTGVSANGIVLSQAATATGNTTINAVIYDANAVFTAVANVGPVTDSLSSFAVKNEDDYLSKTFESDVLYVAKYPGEIGNSLKISICDTASQFNSSVPIVGNTSGNGVSSSIQFTVGSSNAVVTLVAANSTVTTGTMSTLASNTQAQFTIGDLLEAGNTTIGKQYLKILSQGSITTDTVGGLAQATYEIALNEKYALSTNYTSNSAVRYWEYYNSVDQAPGQSQYVQNFGNTSANDLLHVVVADEDGRFTGVPGTILEVFQDLSRATDAKSEDGATLYYKTVINDNSNFIWWANDKTTAPSNTALLVASASGSVPTTISMVMGSDGDDEANVPINILATAYDKFKSAEDIDVSLILQGKARGGANAAQLANYIIDNICEVRKDCVAFISPDRADVVNNIGKDEAEDIKTFRNSISSTSYAVLDSGYKYQYDKYNDVYRYIPLNGDIAGLAVRTDSVRDPWWSPAGFNRGQIKNIIKLAYNPQKADRDILYKAGINPVVTFPGQGTVLFGDKTLLARTSAFDRINVRRLFIVLEKAIATAAKFTLFEFNDEFTRAQFKNLVEPFLRDVQGRRGIYDYKVVCDETNNTAEVIDRNEFVGDIYIKPAKSINFIQLNFVAVRSGVEFSEIVGQF